MPTPTTLDTATAALTGVDWAAVGGGDLLEASVALGRLKAVVGGALVWVAERLEETRGAEAICWASTKDFLTHLTGARKGAGASLVRVAKHTADLPEVRAALSAGEISLAHAGVIGSRVGVSDGQQPRTRPAGWITQARSRRISRSVCGSAPNMNTCLSNTWKPRCRYNEMALWFCSHTPSHTNPYESRLAASTARSSNWPPSPRPWWAILT